MVHLFGPAKVQTVVHGSVLTCNFGYIMVLQGKAKATCNKKVPSSQNCILFTIIVNLLSLQQLIKTVNALTCKTVEKNEEVD